MKLGGILMVKYNQGHTYRHKYVVNIFITLVRVF